MTLNRFDSRRTGYQIDYSLTRKARCGGCGGRATFAVMVHNGYALPVWECGNCGNTHAMRGSWVALMRKLAATDAHDLTMATVAECRRRFPLEA